LLILILFTVYALPMRIKLKYLTSITLFCILMPPTSDAQTADQVAHRYLDAIGGIEAWKGIETSMNEGLFIKIPPVNIFITQGNDTTNVITKFKRPDKFFYRSSNITDSLSSVMCYNGEVVWTKSKSGGLDIQSAEDGVYFSKVMSRIGLADVLLKENTEIVYLGIELLQNKEFYTLRLKGEGWFFSHKYFFDMETGLLFCSTGWDAPTIRHTLYKEYKKTGTILFHSIEEGYDEHWNLESRTIFKKRTINAEVTDSDFNVPTTSKK